ncbi:phage baseplate plug family protein, partial [Salmonella enterica]
MPNFFEIPLDPTPQKFSVTLGTVTYQMTLQYRAAGGAGWVLDIADANGNSLVS